MILIAVDENLTRTEPQVDLIESRIKIAAIIYDIYFKICVNMCTEVVRR